MLIYGFDFKEWQAESKRLEAKFRVADAKFRSLSQDVGNVLRYAVYEAAPLDKGKLRRSLKVTYGVSSRAVTISITSDAKYARYVIEGTGAHLINPKSRLGPGRGPRGSYSPALAFQVGGQTVFARSVRHPGTKPNDFGEKGLRAATGEIEGLFDNFNRWVSEQ